MRHLNFDLPFVVYTKASDVGLGAILARQTWLGTEEVLVYGSGTLNKAEQNYSATERSVWLLYGHWKEGDITWKEGPSL